METSTSFAEMEVSPLLEECVTSFDENEKEYSTAPLTEAATPVVVKCKELNIFLIGREITAFVKGAVEYSFSFSSNEVTLSSKSGETSISAKDVEVSMSGVEIVIGKGEKVENDHISEEGKGDDDPVSSSGGGTVSSSGGRKGWNSTFGSDFKFYVPRLNVDHWRCWRPTPPPPASQEGNEKVIGGANRKVIEANGRGVNGKTNEANDGDNNSGGENGTNDGNQGNGTAYDTDIDF